MPGQGKWSIFTFYPALLPKLIPLLTTREAGIREGLTHGTVECLCLPNPYEDAYSPGGGYLEAGPLGGDELMRVEPSQMGLVLFQEAPESSLDLLLCEDTGRRGLSPDTKSAGALILGFPLELGETGVCCFGHPENGHLFQQPK